jgi:hypothetical protein
MKRLPLGMQDFKQIITEGYVYVDKTRYIHEMLTAGGHSFFMSRPRRFGKTLMVSTLVYLFSGEKELFKGTYIYDKWDFKPCPVIKMSMTGINTETLETVRNTLRFQLERVYDAYDIRPRTGDYQTLFLDLVRQLSNRGPLVLLIDEYDRPILNHLGDPDAAEAIRAVMREFYIVVKDTEPLLKCAFLTGITKITKAGIFSTLNHLTELSTQVKYAAMLGFTAKEIETYFGEYITGGAARLGLSREKLVDQIRDYYDGFSFDGEHFVYNPYSILNFFNEYKLKNYWVSSGPPSSLLEYARTRKLKPEDYLNSYLSEDLLTAYEIERAPPQSFLVQSGYLTFKGEDKYLGYLLDYPNREVRDSFSQLILQSAYDLDLPGKNALRERIITALRERKFAPVFEAMKATLANIPGKLYDSKSDYPQKEAYYHTVILTLLWACELRVHAEEWTSRGISDLVLNFEGDIYVMELKKAPPAVCIAQIKEKGYAEKYATAPYLALVGIEIDAEKRTLKAFDVETLVG